MKTNDLFTIRLDSDGALIVSWPNGEGDRDAAILPADSTTAKLVNILLDGIVGGVR